MYTIPQLSQRSDEDELMAKIKWKSIYERTGSIITDLFYGLFKSTLYCSQCGEIKVFECFLTFSIALNVNYFRCTFVYFDIERQPISVSIAIEPHKCFEDKKTIISKVFNIEINCFIANERKIKDKEDEMICFQIDPSLIANVPTLDKDTLLRNIEKIENRSTEINKTENKLKESNENPLFIESCIKVNIDEYLQIFLTIELKNKQKIVRMILIKEVQNYMKRFLVM